MEKREKRFDLLLLSIFCFFLVWSLLQILAPLALPSNSVTNLSGMSGILDNPETLQDMPFPWNVVYTIGDRMCHQKTERSLFLNGNQMPFCSRCTAIWIGLALGAGIITAYRINLDYKFLLLIFLGIMPIGIDGVGQLIGVWESTNLSRIVTGLLAGVVCGITIGCIVDETRELKKDKHSTH
jgi:uncharacterized membrane protein